MQIENFTSRDMFRFFHQLYLKRTADIDVVFKMVKDLDEFLKEHEMTNQEWNQVNILELRQDCYVIQLQAYINANDVMEFYDKQNVVFVDVLNQVAKYDVEHALPTQQLIVNQAELEHHMENNIVKTEDDASEDHSDTNSNETNVSLEDNDDNNSDDVTINKDTDNANDDMANNQKSSMATVSRKGALKALKHKSRMLRKSKFKHTKNKFSLSIWNQP